MKEREQSYRGIFGVVLPLAMAICSVFAVCSCSDDEQEPVPDKASYRCAVTTCIKNEKGDTCRSFRYGENMVFCLDFKNTGPNDMVEKASHLFASSYAVQNRGLPSTAFIVTKYEDELIGCPYDALNDEDVIIRAGQTTHLECSWLQRSDGHENSSLFICNQERQPLQPGRYFVETFYHFEHGMPSICSYGFEIIE